MIGGNVPGGSARKAEAPDDGFARTIAAVEAATAAEAVARTSRRPTGRGTSRSSGSATQTIVSAPSSATFAANSVVVGAIRTDASTPIATP